MFQNSIFTKFQLQCPQHPKQKATHLCTYLECPHSPFLCSQCKQTQYSNHASHELNIRPCLDGLQDVANLIDRDKGSMDKLYRKTAGRKQNQELIRWQQEKERHYVSIENHVNSMKYQLEEQLATIERLFEKAMTDAKKAMVAELDAYFKLYRDNFQLFSRLIDPLVAFNRSHKYFSNLNNIQLKLLTEPPKEGGEWLNSLKSCLIFSQKMVSNPLDFTQNLERGTSYMNSMVDSLPMIQNDQKKVEAILKKGILEALRNMLRLTELKSLNSILNGDKSLEVDRKKRPQQ